MNISEWMKHARDRLAQTGCPDPDIDARWIAEDVLDMTRQALFFEADRAIPRPQLIRLESMLDRRAAGEPVQYILGVADFMGLKFRVDGSVLIPRQDTEALVEAALIDLRRRPGKPAVLEALGIARANQRELGVKAELRQGDLFDAVKGERFDVIASNPPYIPTSDLDALQREVRFEPRIALDGGADGLDFYRRIAQSAPDHLAPGGAIFLEVGAGEAPAVLALLKAALPGAEVGTVSDLNGIERVVYGKMGN